MIKEMDHPGQSDMPYTFGKVLKMLQKVKLHEFS